MNFKKTILMILLPIALSANELTDSITFDGFGSIGATYNQNKDFTYRNDFLSNTGSQGDVDVSNNTKFGGQVNIDINEKMSAVIQGTISQKEKDKINLNLEWANIKFKENENFNFRIGRMRAPMFMYSDILKVSYAYPWVNPPIEVYSPIPFTSYNGIETEFKTTIKDWELSSQFMYGNNKEDMYLSKDEKTAFGMNNYKGVVLTAANDKLKLRLSYTNANVKMNSNSLQQLSLMLDSNGYQDISSKYLKEETKFNFLVTGVNYEDEDFFIISEYATFSSTGGVENYKGAYVSTGIHTINNLTPYVTLGKSIQKNRDIKNLVPSDGATKYVYQSLSYMNKVYNISQESATLGLRWDFLKSAALKGEYQHIRTGQDSNSLHFKENDGNKLNVFSISLDFLF